MLDVGLSGYQDDYASAVRQLSQSGEDLRQRGNTDGSDEFFSVITRQLELEDKRGRMESAGASVEEVINFTQDVWIHENEVRALMSKPIAPIAQQSPAAASNTHSGTDPFNYFSPSFGSTGSSQGSAAPSTGQPKSKSMNLPLIAAGILGIGGAIWYFIKNRKKAPVKAKSQPVGKVVSIKSAKSARRAA